MLSPGSKVYYLGYRAGTRTCCGLCVHVCGTLQCALHEILVAVEALLAHLHRRSKKLNT